MRRVIHIMGLIVMAVMLSGCNPSIQKVVTKTNKVDNNAAQFQLPLHTVFDPGIFAHEFRYMDYSAASKDLIYSCSEELFKKDVQKHTVRMATNDEFNGYIKCHLVKSTEKSKAWGPILTVLTAGLCPMGHVKFERQYDFEIYDAMGQRIAKYRIKGTKNNIMGLYNTNNYDGSELFAFRNALKQFYKTASHDATRINRSLKSASEQLNQRLNRDMTERDITLADWLNSGETLPIATIDKAIEDAPDDYVGWGLRIQYHLNTGSYNSALSDLEQYCELNPSCQIIMPYYVKADLLYGLGRKEEALEALTLAKAYHPDMEALYVLEGTILCDLGAVTSAIKTYEKALKINNDNLEVTKILSELRTTKKDLEKMREQEDSDEAARKAAAMSQIAAAYNNISVGVAQLTSSKQSTGPTRGQSIGGGSSTSTDRKSRVTTKECRMCHGNGWIAGNSNPSFEGGTYYCDDCRRRVPESHSHDDCPSCRGNGEVTTIRH